MKRLLRSIAVGACNRIIRAACTAYMLYALIEHVLIHHRNMKRARTRR